VGLYLSIGLFSLSCLSPRSLLFVKRTFVSELLGWEHQALPQNKVSPIFVTYYASRTSVQNFISLDCRVLLIGRATVNEI